MKITVALRLKRDDAKYPSLALTEMAGAVYSQDDQALIVTDSKNRNRAVVPWDQVLYVLYDDYPADIVGPKPDPYVLPMMPEGQSFAPTIDPVPQEETLDNGPLA